MLRKLILLWAAFLAVHFGSLLLPHRDHSLVGSINFALQFLLFLLCFQMARKDVKQFRPGLINLAILFGFSILMYLSIFVGTIIFRDEPYASVYYHQFVNKFGYNALFAFAILYLLVDYVFQNWKVLTKYIASFCIAGLILVPLYYPYFKDPLHLYRTQDYSSFLELLGAHSLILEEKGSEPTQPEIIEKVLAQRVIHGGRLKAEDNRKERQELSKLTTYLSSGDSRILFWKPLNLNTVYVNVFLMMLMVSVYFMEFRRDRPYGAYLEKIMLLLFIICSFQVLHSWAYVMSVEEGLYYSVHGVAQYFMIAVLLALVYVCAVRLRFLVSPVGRYYERMVLLHPEAVSRWRDEIDRFVLKTFLSQKPFAKRLGTLDTEEKDQSTTREGKK